MRTSAAGIAAIRQREGCRLRAYLDTVNVWTIGVGRARTAFGRPITAGLTITQAQADQLLTEDLARFEQAVSAAVVVPLTQNEFDACVSLAFNIGMAAFARSTVVRRLNAGNRPGAADAFLMWNKPPELTGRRRAERQQFLGCNPVVAAHVGPPQAARKPIPKTKAAAATAVVVASGAATAAGYQGSHAGVWAFLGLAVGAAAVFAFFHFRRSH